MTDDVRLIVKCVLIVILTALVLVRFAKACQCEVCGAAYGICRRRPYPGTVIDLCRHHATLYDTAPRLKHTDFLRVRGLWRSA